MIFFVVKKILTPLFYPLSVVFVLFLAGGLLMARGKRCRLGAGLLISGMALLFVCSFVIFVSRVVTGLENRYPPLVWAQEQKPPPLRWIAVLGGGHHDAPDLPISSQIGETTLIRLLEGVRLYRLVPGSRLVVSGGAFPGDTTEAQVMADAAEVMGVPREHVVLENRSLDTEEQARRIKAYVGDTPFALVTSALHMPRAMALFQKHGLYPLAAPAGRLVNQGKRLTPWDFYPSSRNLRDMEMAVHEMLGLLWIKVKGP